MHRSVIFLASLAFLAHAACVCSESVGARRRKFPPSMPGRFSQSAIQAGRNDEKGVMSLLFHGPVAPRHISFGIEDSNEGVAKEIAIAEDMTTLENTLNRLQENEQNQLDAVQESMFLQNAQIDELQRFISRPPRNTTAVSKHVNN